MSLISSDPLSLPNDSSSTTLHDPGKDWKVEHITGILRNEQGEVRAPGISLSARMATATGTDSCHSDESGHTMTINMLSDNVLLEIFDCCRFIDNQCLKDFNFNRPLARSLALAPSVWGWLGLAQVCQRWRHIIFGSPRRLDLQILCSYRRPAKNILDCFPPFPIAIQCITFKPLTPDEEGNLSAALKHPGRIRQVDFWGPKSEEVITTMERPFPALTHLTLRWDDERPLLPLPSGFLGGSAPCLKHVHLAGILFPELPMFLSSTSDLVNLCLKDIPQDGYISPEVMTTCLAALPRLQSLFIGSYTATSHTDRILPPPVTRTLLPALTSFGFQGDSKYLEELVARINSPQLSLIYIKYLNPDLDFQVAQFMKFVDRSEDPKISVIKHADIDFLRKLVTFEMYPCPESPDWGRVTVLLHCHGIERQVSCIAQMFSQPSAILSRVVHLKLTRDWTIVDRHTDCLPLLRPFAAVQTLHVSRCLAVFVALALEHVTQDSVMVVEVLPVLDLICLDGQPVSCVEKFLAARQLAGHPITIVQTEAEFDRRIR